MLDFCTVSFAGMTNIEFLHSLHPYAAVCSFGGATTNHEKILVNRYHLRACRLIQNQPNFKKIICLITKT